MLEILSGLSCALDLVEGQMEGHAIRTALFSQKVGQALGLSESQTRSLVLAALLKDTGCSASSGRVHRIFAGDDHLAKTVVKFIDWSSPYRSFTSSLKYAGPNGDYRGWFNRLSRGFRWPQKVMHEIAEARRRQGAEMASELGCPAEVSQAIRCLDEHWDGRGAPQGLSGEQIPLAARIVGAAQTFDVFASRFGMTAAFAVLTERHGSWFDPQVVQATESFSYDRDFWNEYSHLLRAGARVMPGLEADTAATEPQIDLVCSVFARIIDAKSSFGAGHSTRVAALASSIAAELGFDPARLNTLWRAACLHDIGKLGVPHVILDKASRLSPAEASALRGQVRYTQLVLQPIPGFERVSEVAFAHNEALDGSGFWRGLSAGDLDLDQQVLAVADMFDALVSERPYKPVLAPEAALDAITEAGARDFDFRLIQALELSVLRLSRIA